MSLNVSKINNITKAYFNRVKIDATKYDRHIVSLGEPVLDEIRQISPVFSKRVRTYNDGTKVIDIDKFVPYKLDYTVSTTIRVSGNILIRSRRELYNLSTIIKTSLIKPNGDKLRKIIKFGKDGLPFESTKIVENKKGNYKKSVYYSNAKANNNFIEKYNKAKEMISFLLKGSNNISFKKYDKQTKTWKVVDKINN